MLIRRSTSIIYRFLLVSSADFMTPITGVVPTVQLAKAGGALVAATNAAVERGGGWYEVTLTAPETNTIGPLAIVATGAGAAPWRDIAQVYADLASGGAIAFTYTVTDSATTLPLDGVEVVVTTDAAGQNTAARGTTDAFGNVVFYLDPGVYYFWSSRAGYAFTNPDTETVS